jgi:hypothetical protein
MIPNSPSAQNCVIPAQTGIQMIKKSPREAGQCRRFVRFAGCLFLLDSRLRGNDELMGDLE